MVNKYNLLFLIKLSNGIAHEFRRTSLQKTLKDAIEEAISIECAVQFDNINFVLHSILSEEGETVWSKQPKLKRFSLNFSVYRGRTTISKKITSEVEADSVEQAKVAATELANNLNCDSLITYTLTSIVDKETGEEEWSIYWINPKKLQKNLPDPALTQLLNTFYKY
jgi:hypothetical protein